ncbi:MAG: PilZ domain-containing protein [Tepidisphaeraceae bacterium]
MLALKRDALKPTTNVPYMTLTDNVERRKHRRHDLSDFNLPVYAMVDGPARETVLGKLIDISAGGMRFRTVSRTVATGGRIDVQLTLPAYAGIRPFVDQLDEQKFSTEWQGQLHVTRVVPLEDGTYDVAGQLLGLNDGERGLLGLYLSTQPMAA